MKKTKKMKEHKTKRIIKQRRSRSMSDSSYKHKQEDEENEDVNSRNYHCCPTCKQNWRDIKVCIRGCNISYPPSRGKSDIHGVKLADSGGL